VLLTFAAHFLKAGMRRICALTNGRQVKGSLRIRTVVDRRLEAKIGGDSALQISVDGSPAELRAQFEEYQAAGVGHLVVYLEADDLQTTLRACAVSRRRCARRFTSRGNRSGV
jgi:alkanesulfonate monooxygenase SsuD/methylene tetrahydromethanopterin reductase-like flavin-dependent oxidoreductase (luciferase family)